MQRVLRATVFSLISSPALARVIEGMNNGKNLKSFDIVTRSMPTQGGITKPVRITNVDAERQVLHTQQVAERRQQAEAWFGNQRQQFDKVWNEARQKVQAAIAESRGKL